MQLVMNLAATGSWSTHIFDAFTSSVLPWAPLTVNTVNTIYFRANLYKGQTPYTSINFIFWVPFSTSATILYWFPVDMSSGSSLSWILLMQNFSSSQCVCLSSTAELHLLSALVPLHMYENHASFYNTLTHMDLWAIIFPWCFLVELFLNQNLASL